MNQDNASDLSMMSMRSHLTHHRKRFMK